MSSVNIEVKNKHCNRRYMRMRTGGASACGLFARAYGYTLHKYISTLISTLTNFASGIHSEHLARMVHQLKHQNAVRLVVHPHSLADLSSGARVVKAHFAL